MQIWRATAESLQLVRYCPLIIRALGSGPDVTLLPVLQQLLETPNQPRNVT